MANAFEDIFEKPRGSCYRTWTDGGGEYISNYFKNILKKHGIELYSTQSELKAIMAELFNKTLMNKNSRMFTERDSYRYIDKIDGIVNKYNNTYHSSIKMTPVEASKKENEGIVYFLFFIFLCTFLIQYNTTNTRTKRYHWVQYQCHTQWPVHWKAQFTLRANLRNHYTIG